MTKGDPKTELGIKEAMFILNGEPTFLLGISYYGALGAPKKFIRKDLDDMQRYGFNWFRVWATWSAWGNDVSAVDGKGRPREPYLRRLDHLVKDADERAMAVDITLSRWNGVTGPPRLKSAEALSEAARTVVTYLRSYRNWYLDTANERNIKDSRYVSFQELKAVRKLVKKLDPKRLVTSSHAGDLAREELRQYLQTAHLDFITPHRPRHIHTPRETEKMTRLYLGWMEEIATAVPVHYQEPFRRGFNPGRWEPKAENYVRDLEGAKTGGASGWCLHNGDQRNKPDGQPRRSFDLREKRLFEQLDDEEQKVLESIHHRTR